MGCDTVKEKLEDKIMNYRLKRMAIQIEKEKQLKILSELEGQNIERPEVPDYIDPDFGKFIPNNQDDKSDEQKNDKEENINEDKNDKIVENKNDNIVDNKKDNIADIKTITNNNLFNNQINVANDENKELLSPDESKVKKKKKKRKKKKKKKKISNDVIDPNQKTQNSSIENNNQNN